MKELRCRAKSGSTIMETGPALWLLLLMFFFPLVDLLYLCISYGGVAFLNEMQIREAVLTPKSQLDIRLQDVTAQWMHTGFASLLGAKKQPQSTFQYVDAHTASDAVAPSKLIELQTRAEVRPFVYVPFFFAVPGLNAPVLFACHQRRLLENPRDFQL